mgnify:CR=1 FL=1
MTPASARSPTAAAARDTSAKRSRITPVLARRAPRRLTGRRGEGDAIARGSDVIRDALR